MLPKKPQSWPVKIYVFQTAKKHCDTKYVPARSWAGLSMACSPMPTAEVFTDNNEQAAATEAADGLRAAKE